MPECWWCGNKLDDWEIGQEVTDAHWVCIVQAWSKLLINGIVTYDDAPNDRPEAFEALKRDTLASRGVEWETGR